MRRELDLIPNTQSEKTKVVKKLFNNSNFNYSEHRLLVPDWPPSFFLNNCGLKDGKVAFICMYIRATLPIFHIDSIGLYLFYKEKWIKWDDFDLLEFFTKKSIGHINLIKNVREDFPQYFSTDRDSSFEYQKKMAGFIQNRKGFFFANKGLYRVADNGITEWELPDMILKNKEEMTEEHKKPWFIPNETFFDYELFTKYLNNEIDFRNDKEYEFVADFAKKDEELTKTLFTILAKVNLYRAKMGSIVVINGGGNNGKSEFLRLIKKTNEDGIQNEASIKMLDAGHKMIYTTLINRVAVLFDEEYKLNKSRIALLKDFTDKNCVKSFEEKYKTSFSKVIPPQNYIFSTNEVYHINSEINGREALRRRFCFIELKNNFGKYKARHDPESIMYNKKSLTKIMTIAFYYFVKSKCKIYQTKEMKELYAKRTRPKLEQFLDNLFEEVIDITLEKNGKIIYEEYKSFCKDNRWENEGKIRFNKLLENTDFDTYDVEKVRLKRENEFSGKMVNGWWFIISKKYKEGNIK